MLDHLCTVSRGARPINQLELGASGLVFPKFPELAHFNHGTEVLWPLDMSDHGPLTRSNERTFGTRSWSG